jgi:ADP-L-glycero-D-manno-heptose 6-epimerase
MPTYVVTGGAGFIGSNIAAALDARGDDVVVIDRLGTGAKWHNIAKRRLEGLVAPEDMFQALDAMKGPITGVFHMGAISSTQETDADLIVDTNFRLSCRLWHWCAAHSVPFIYASSAATYGDGSHGFHDRDDAAYLALLRPLNPYGWSKHLFDRWACSQRDRRAPMPPRWAGLKFFNVFGPNEYHKEGQRSVALQVFEQIKAGADVKLFTSCREGYADGEQKRDFVWIGDCVATALWFADSPQPNGVFNAGSGIARSYNDLAHAVYAAIDERPRITYVAMPAGLRDAYQYYTRSEPDKLERAGFTSVPTSLEDGVRHYVSRFLTSADRYN